MEGDFSSHQKQSRVLLVATLLVIAWFALVGFALLLLTFRRVTFQLLLLAPATGTALSVLALQTASRVGLTIGEFTWPFFAACTISAAAVIVVQRAKLSLVTPIERRYCVIASVICVVAIVLSGWPILLYGSNWLSYGNDDMVNYSLGAMRLLDHYYYQAPNPINFAQGRDVPDSYFFLHVLSRERIGAELTLAFISKILGIVPFSAFMPAMLIFHASMVASVGGIVRSSNAARFVAMGAMSLSALETLGTEYQLLGQAFGLTLLSTVATLAVVALQREFEWRACALVGVTGGAMLIAYPEVLPFLVLGCGGYAVVQMASKSLTLRGLLERVVVAIGSAAILLNGQLVQVYVLLLERQSSTQVAGGDESLTLFPYYLLPSGFANLYGILPVAVLGDEPFTSLAIGLGMCATVMVFATLYQGLRGGEISAWILLAMIIVSVIFFKAQAGFPLYKLAMYLQGPIVATWAVVAVRVQFKIPWLRMSRVSTPAARNA